MTETLERWLLQLEVAVAYAGQMALKTHERGGEADDRHLLVALHALQQKGQK